MKKNVLSCISILSCFLFLAGCASTKGMSVKKADKQLSESNVGERELTVHVETYNELKNLVSKIKRLGAGDTLKLTLTCGDSVTSIDSGIFRDCKNLSAIILPEGITSIKDNAFINCVNLKNVVVPDSLKLINETAFLGCGKLIGIKDYSGKTPRIMNLSSIMSLTKFVDVDSASILIQSAENNELTLPVYVKNSSELKKMVTAIKVLPDNVSVKLNLACSGELKSIDSGVFNNCDNVTHINIPDGVISIGDRAFSGCDNLVSLHFPETLKSIDRFAFLDCMKLNSFSGSREGDKLLKSGNVLIGFSSVDGAAEYLQNCDSEDIFLKVYIEDSFNLLDLVSEINSIPFGTNVSLELLFDDSVSELGRSSFENCRNLVSLVVHGNIKTVEEKAFKGCVNLAYVELPDTVETVDFRAFIGCSSLEEFIAPAKAKNMLKNRKILASYLDVSKAIEKLDVHDSGELKLKVFVSDGDELSELALKIKNLPEVAKVDLSLAFSENVTTIKTGTFEGCKSLTGIIIPEGITSLENGSFKDCINLVSVELPDSIKAMDYRTFLGCVNLGPVNVPKNARESMNNRPLLYNYLDLNKTREKILTSYVGKDPLILRVYVEDDAELSMLASMIKSLKKNVLVNLEIAGSEKLSVIGKETFKGCENIVRIVIPEGIVKIEEKAFQDCINLKNVIIPGSIKDIDYRAFLGCVSLESIDEPENPFKIQKL